MILKDLTPAGKKINRGVSMGIFANPGAGKTTLLTTLPPKETLIVNIEAGLGPLLGKGHIVFNVLDAVENELEKCIDDLYKQLRTTKHPFKYVCIDNISELESQLILNLTERRGKESPTLREYGDASFKMRQWLHNFRDLVFEGINVVFNAWEFPMEIRNVEGNVITLTVPKMSKSLVPSFCGLIDIIGHLEVHEKTGKRWVRFKPNDQCLCKSQFKGIAGPSDNSGEIADLSHILDKVKGYDYETTEDKIEHVLDELTR